MSVTATLLTLWRAKKIGEKLTGFFTNPKALLAMVLLGVIIYLGISGHYKSLKITNLTTDVSVLEQKNASLEASIEEQNKKIQTQNTAVEEYERKSKDLEKRVAKLNAEVQKARLETQAIITQYNNAPVECSAAFNWAIEQLQFSGTGETQ